MPELPEVETTRLGITRHITGKKISAVVVRESRLRWPVPATLASELPGQQLLSVERRGKYLLLKCAQGCLLLHLGMSGSLRILDSASLVGKHDHFDIAFEGDTILRLKDPRRFGSVLWTADDPLHHPLLAKLGPEPLNPDFTGAYLKLRAQNRTISIKQFIMDSHVVVGVGNIYANEALFKAGIHPARQAGRISEVRYEKLAEAIKEVLNAAIARGGTTLRDFHASDGAPGYFEMELKMYGRAGRVCTACNAVIQVSRQGQRATYYCMTCQR